MAVKRSSFRVATSGADNGVHYYPPGPVGKAFLASDAFICGIMGPIGSGKSTLCEMKLIRNQQKQRPGRDGISRRRTAIIRNTYPELKTTTIKTWHQWVPAHLGRWTESGPPTHFITGKGKNGVPYEWEVMFIALDRPDDVRKLLSMELSDAWINEAREVPKAIMDGLTGRVGRFPPTERNSQGNVMFTCDDPMIVMDTNPPDSDHWWAKGADFPTAELMEEREQLRIELVKAGALRVDQPLVQFLRQPGGRSPHAENLQNLSPGYYLKAMVDKKPEWIKVYVDAEYGFVLDGKPVYSEYRDSVHCKEFNLNRLLPLLVGMDFGLTPAAIVGQHAANGQWRWHSEVVTTRMGITNFAGELKRHIAETYPGFTVGRFTGDPAGSGADQEERTTFQILDANGIKAHPAPTNEFNIRRDAVGIPLSRMIDGEPGLVIHPDMRVTRKGMAGAYCLRRIQVLGDERFKDAPDKNMYSHVCEAGQYLNLGGGEGKLVIGRGTPVNRPAEAISDYNIMG